MNLPIRLDQFLKLVGFAQSGGEAKVRVQSGEVRVDGEVETRRGRQLRGGELVELEGRAVKVGDQVFDEG